MSSSADIPTLLAGYRIERELGHGGMGRVYLAEHVHLQRRLALKVLAPHLTEDETFRERFVRESRLLAAIDHPNIIPIYDAGEADGLLYIAMRYVDGEDLKASVEREHGFEPEDVVTIVGQIADALDAAHARDLVHRDVKPANVLLEGPTHRIFLTDFGLAKRLRSDGMSAEGLFLGTIDYAAPEQIEGREVGPPADVYALGCVLYECLTGATPFPKETDVAVVHAHLIDPPPRVTATRTDLPTALDDVIATALAKSPDERFASCGELAQAAYAALGGAPPSIVAATHPLRASPTPLGAGDVSKTLPVEATPLVGRDDDVQRVCELLATDDVRLVTLTGPGGTGKTRLAIAAAVQLATVYPQGVFFVDLAPVSDPAVVEARIAEVLGVEEPSDGSDVGAALRLRIGGAQLLLVLDNLEQVLPAAPRIADLLEAGLGVNVLATSRGPLRLRGEHVYEVPPLSVPERGDLEGARDSPAVQLFVDRAQGVRPDFELTAANADAVVAVCSGLDGLPLALELAAGWMKLLTPHEVLARFERRLELLTGGDRDRPSRHQTLRGAIDWSYELLGDEEQVLLSLLAVFSDGWTLAAAESVAAAQERLGLLEGLSSLAEASLVRRSETRGGDSRFAMLQTVQEYALFRLVERGEVEVEAVRRRHAEYYADFAEEAEPELLGPDQDAWLVRLDGETANFRAAMRWSLDSGELIPGLRIAGALPRFWSIRGHMSEGRAWLELGLAQTADVPDTVRAKALFAAGYAALGQGDYDRAVRGFDEALPLYRASDNSEGVARCLAQLGWLATARGEGERAASLSDESFELARQLGDKRTASVALSNLAEAAAADEDYARATRLFKEALELRRAVGDRRNVANALLNLGRIEQARGDLDVAARVLNEGLELARQLEDTWSISVALSALAQVAVQQGSPEHAHALLDEALHIAQRRGDRRMIAGCLQTAAAIAIANADYARAARIWGAADALREGMGASLSPAERAVEELSLESVRLALDDDSMAQERAAGRVLELDKAIALALIA